MRTTMLAAAAMLAGCSPEPAPKAPANETAPSPAAVPAAEPSPARQSYVGRWAAKPELCATGAWSFTEKHLTAADGVSCDFDAVQEKPGGYDVTATCMIDGARRTETIALRFTVSADVMMVDSKLFRPAVLEECKGDAGVVTVPVTAVDNSD